MNSNTNAGAFEIACNLLTYDRYTHSLAVAERARGIAIDLGMTQNEIDKVYQAGMLYNIGHAPEILMSDNHNLNGFYYLLMNGWDRTIQEVALRHNFAGKFLLAYQPKLIKIYSNSENILKLQTSKLSLTNIITITDMTISATGEFISLEAKKQEIADTYGSNSNKFKHFVINEERLKKLEVKYLSK